MDLLATKLHFPASRMNGVFRERLFKRLDRGVSHLLTLIAAGAGFGKTTLVSDWAQQTSQRVAWVALDPGDNDRARFLAYLIRALQKVHPTFGHTALMALVAPHPPAIELLLTDLVNQLQEIGPIVLILDDYHVIEDSQVDQLLQFILDHAPSNLHVVIATRYDPSLSLSRFRARDQLHEIRADDLRFSVDEALVFLRETMNLEVDRAQVIALDKSTEGWPAGLQFVGLALRGHQDATGFMAGFSGGHRFILDYLTDEVLHGQPKLVRDFLLRTSVLPRLCGSLCDAVLEGDNSEEMLLRLERANLFLVPLDDEREWFRYHHLFQDVLQQRLLAAHQNFRGNDLRLRGSAWFVKHGLLEEGLDLAIGAEAFQEAATLVENNTRPWLLRGLGGKTLRWFKLLPDEVFHHRPLLLLDHALALTFDFQLEASAERLGEAERLLETEYGVYRKAIRGLTALHQNQHREAIHLLVHAKEHLLEDWEPLRGHVSAALGTAYLGLNDLDAAREAYKEAVGVNRRVGNALGTTLAQLHLADFMVAEGRLGEALESYEGLQESIETGALSGLATAGAAEIHRELNALDHAATMIEEAIDLGRRSGQTSLLVPSLFVAACIQHSSGNRQEALQILEEADSIMRRTGIPVWREDIKAYRARFLVGERSPEALKKVGDWAETTGLISNAQRGLNWRLLFDHPPDFSHLTLARLFIAEEKVDQAITLLRWLEGEAVAAKRMRSLVEILALEALALHKDNLDKATATLGKALDLAEPESLIRVFADERRPMAVLLKHTLQRYPQRVSPEYAWQLQLSLRSRSSPTLKSNRAADLLEPLSNRELEVLQTIAAGLTNREAAHKLFVEPSTVKKHLEHVYGKLGVRNRTQAIARARELHLFDGC